MKPDGKLFGVQPQHGHDWPPMDAARVAVGSLWWFKYLWIWINECTILLVLIPVKQGAFFHFLAIEIFGQI